MAVTVDAVATQFASIAGESSPKDIAAATFGLTIGTGSNRALTVELVFVATVTSPAFIWDQGGTNQSATLIKSQAGVNGQLTCLFGLIAPTSGNKAVRVTWTGGTTEFHCQAESWTLVNQTGGTTSFPNGVAATGNSNTASVTVTSAVGNATVSAAVAGSLQAISSVTATQTFLIHGVGAIESGGSRADGSASNVMTATYAGTDQWAMVGMDILSDGAALPAVPGGSLMDDQWRRPSVLWSGTSTLGTKRSAWSDGDQNPAVAASRDYRSFNQ